MDFSRNPLKSVPEFRIVIFFLEFVIRIEFFSQGAFSCIILATCRRIYENELSDHGEIPDRKFSNLKKIEIFEIKKSRNFQRKFNENRKFRFLRFSKISIFIEFSLQKFSIFSISKISKFSRFQHFRSEISP